MQQIYSDTMQFRGSHYEFGYRQGELIKDSVMKTNRQRQWKVRKPRFSIREDEVKEAILSIAPGIWDELIGLQDGLKN